MPDPIDELENFSVPGPPMTPLPAAEVRRRGNRIRRRNNALATVGALAVVAAIATPFAVAAGGGSGDQAPEPAPSISWVEDVPDGFPLDAGMGTEDNAAHVGTERGEVVFSTVVICEQEVWTPEQPESTDALGAVWSDGIEGGEQRTLALYPDDDTAQAALGDMRDAVTSCPEPTGGGDAIVPVELEASAGDEALAYMDQYRDSAGPTGEGNAFVVTRVGNALLLDKTYFGGAGSTEIGQQTVDLLQDRASGVVAAMCVFSSTPCRETPAASESADAGKGTGEGAVSAIPTGFPLDRGLSSFEGEPMIRPAPDADGVPPVELCGRSVWPVPGVERLAVTATGPEYLETRELVTYASIDEATSALAAIRSAVTECDAITGVDAGLTGADDHVTFATLPEQGLGGEIYQFAQVGRALYATMESGHFSARTLSASVEDLTSGTESVLPDLCIWTETGC